MIEIIPAVIPESYEDLVSHITRVRGAVSWIQIDVADGMFVDRSSWPYNTDDKIFAAMVADERGLPFWEDINYEVDLFINHPFQEAPKWALAGVARIILHYQTLLRGDGVGLCASLQDQGVEVILGLQHGDDSSVVEQYREYIVGVQCMGIRRIGFQGEPFDDTVIAKVSAVRDMYPELVISVDGGVTADTARALVDAGATRLISGSYIFTSEDAKASIAELQKISNV